MIIYLKDEYLFFTSSNTSNIFLHSFDKSSFKLLKLYIFAQNQKSADFHQRISDFVKMQQKDAALTREKKLQKKKSLNYACACRGSRLAGEQGFEPQQTESESVVLPLHNSATCLLRQNLLYPIFFISQGFFEKILEIPAFI